MTTGSHIVVLGSYPSVVPRHGGQIRLAEVTAAYKRTGTAVTSINVFDRLSYADQAHGPLDFLYPAASRYRSFRGEAIPLIDDLTSGHFAAADDGIYQELTRALPKNVTMVHLEQPWLFPLVQRWRKEGHIGSARLVYGSQNVEAPLKAAILRQYAIASADAVAAEIALLEGAVCRAADYVLAVSDADRLALQALTGKPVVLAQNGIAPWSASEGKLLEWRQRLTDKPFALFVGSAHPPNISGFFDWFGDSLGFLPPDTRIVVCGSVGSHLPQDPRFKRWLPLNESRIRIIGVLEEDDLAAVKSLARVFVLPISEGGGSNIKTAEALFSGTYVVGTPTSFRGFGRYLQEPGVHQADTPRDFRRAVTSCLPESPLHLDEPARALRRQLVWEKALAPIKDIVDRAAREAK